MTLPIPKLEGRGNIASFGDCLNAFVDCEKLTGDNMYECPTCKKKVNAQKTSSIETAPRILMIDFIRYGLGKKCTDIIEYPKKFDARKYKTSWIDSMSGA